MFNNNSFNSKSIEGSFNKNRYSSVLQNQNVNTVSKSNFIPANNQGYKAADGKKYESYEAVKAHNYELFNMMKKNNNNK